MSPPGGSEGLADASIDDPPAVYFRLVISKCQLNIGATARYE